MRFTPPPTEIGPNDGFGNGIDIFGYADFGQRFADLACNIDQSLTVVLDGPWGSGKSTFIQQWAGLLRNNGVPVILFDAFANDHHEDAFIALAGEIIALAKEELGGSASRTRRLANSAKKVGAAFLPLAARATVRAGTLSVISLEDVEEAGDVVKSIAKDFGNEAAKATEKAISDRMGKAREERLALDAFRERLADLAVGLSDKAAERGEDGQRGPLVFIVDELDRCRPPFALNLIERVKHLFSVTGVTFVMVTNLDQMNKIVEGAYGSGVDGHMYLEKFYDLRAVLPAPTEPHREGTNLYAEHLWRVMEIESGEARVDELVLEGLSNMAVHNSISLRRLERIVTHVALTFASSGRGTMKLAPLIVGLCVMRQEDHALYEIARRGDLTWKSAKDFIGTSEWGDDTRPDWYEKIWRFFIDPDADTNEEWFKDLNGSFARYSFGNRLTVVPWATKQIDEFAVAERE